MWAFLTYSWPIDTPLLKCPQKFNFSDYYIDDKYLHKNLLTKIDFHTFPINWLLVVHLQVCK